MFFVLWAVDPSVGGPKHVSPLALFITNPNSSGYDRPLSVALCVQYIMTRKFFALRFCQMLTLSAIITRQ